MKRNLSVWLGLAASRPAGIGICACKRATSCRNARKRGQNSRQNHQSYRATAGQRHREPLHRRWRDVEVHLPGFRNRRLQRRSACGNLHAGLSRDRYTAGKMVDSIRGVKIVAGQDLAQDDDMSRQEYIDKMSPEEKKQLEDLKKANAEALKANSVINQLNADLKVVARTSMTSTPPPPPRPRRSALRHPRPTLPPRRLRSRPPSTPISKP